jgi:hypothetical protein
MVIFLGAFMLGCVAGSLYAQRTAGDVIPRFEHYDEKAQARAQAYCQLAVARPGRKTWKVGDDGHTGSRDLSEGG